MGPDLRRINNVERESGGKRGWGGGNVLYKSHWYSHNCSSIIWNVPGFRLNSLSLSLSPEIPQQQKRKFQLIAQNPTEKQILDIEEKKKYEQMFHSFAFTLGPMRLIKLPISISAKEK